MSTILERDAYTADGRSAVGAMVPEFACLECGIDVMFYSNPHCCECLRRRIDELERERQALVKQEHDAREKWMQLSVRGFKRKAGPSAWSARWRS